MSAGLARVTISAPQRRVDVALPEHVPLVELLPEMLRHAGEGLADDGEKHGGWLLRRAGGDVLATAQGLFPQGVRDGEVLHLVPARAAWPELEYDDVVEAIADGARRRGPGWTPASTRTATLVAGGVLLAVSFLALLLNAPRVTGAAYVALGVGLLLTVAGVAASRGYGDGRTGAALGGYALPYGFLGGAALVTSGDRVGALPFAGWVGADELLAGCVVMLVLAPLGAVGVAASIRVFAAGGTAGLLGALAALAAMIPGVPPAGGAALLVAVLVCGIGALPLLAIRFGKVPMPPVALPSGGDAERGFTGSGGGTLDAARERPDRDRVFASVARTEELLTGMLIGHAVLAAGAFLVLVGDGWGRILTAVAATALLLRSRLFVTVRQRVPMVSAGLLGLGALGLAVASGAVLVLVSAVLVLAVLAVVA